MIKGADKDTAVVVWGRDDYLKEASKQLKDKDVYEEVQNDDTVIGTTFAPPYAIIYMTDLEERILKYIELRPRIWQRYTDETFFTWEHGEDSLKQLIETLNSCHPTMKFTAEWSKKK